MRVLVAEDEPVLARMLGAGLRREGMAVDVVRDGNAVRDLLELTEYDVLVLDRDLPGTHGDTLCRSLAASDTRTRILMLTAAGTLHDRVRGLGLGADDYLCKPFEFPELVARIQALARRAAPATPPRLRHAGLTLDTVRRNAERDGRTLSLTAKEFGVLRVLMEADGGVVSAEELLERVWDAHADPFTGAVRVTMSKLRAKLGAPDPIRTLPGSGYALC
ncbi:response regulator transcription factor [Streptomyces sp. WAC06614]|uniref:response regulator transcription factor n=1 Tax=Streptomyces sp. WAC06614 TaxID=2487416 RepID=UPI000F7A14D5|nr:response regulator transcription factor [Streptomyces sp. WAC06614]RSS81121.1 DNA-binding response regulator [Streptomyces sp. WAC06614]